MSTRKATLSLAIACALALGGGYQSVMAAMQPTTQNGVSFISGGVGQDESDAIRGQFGHYNLHLTFAAANGEFMADIQVKISDAAGKTLVQTTADGPFLLASVPPGQYRVSATAGSSTKQQSINVPQHGPAELRFTWDVAASSR
jgi:hypothetical protein